MCKSVSLIAAILLLGLAVNISNASLIAQYQFEGNANDSSGNGNNGTFIGGATTINDAQRGQVLSLDGVNDYVDCGTGPAIVGTGGFTVAAWIKTTNPLNGAIVTQRDPYGPDGSYALDVVNHRVEMHVYNSGMGLNFRSSQTVDDGTWHFVVGVRRNAGSIDIGEIYIDGNLVLTSTATSKSLNSVGVLIGKPYTTEYYFKGLIDDVRIYNNDLSAAEIRALIPEPATLALLGLGAILLKRRSRI